MAYSWRVLLLVTGVTSVGWAAQPGPTGQLRKYGSETPAVSAIEVIYHVDPMELVGALMVVLTIWEFLKWFVVEAGKTIFVDAVLRKLTGWCRRRQPEPEEPRVLVAPPESFDGHNLTKIYKLSRRADYKVHLFPTCRRLEGATPIEQGICSDCIDEVQSKFTATLFSVVEHEVDLALKKHGVHVAR